MKINIYKIFGYIIKISLITYVGYYLLMFIVIAIQERSTVITNLKQYENALSRIKEQDMIAHFPKSIPLNAKDIKLYFRMSDYGTDIYLLEFKTNNEYIKSELKKNNFINPDTSIGEKQKLYHFYSTKHIKPDKYTFYVINNEKNRRIINQYFPYYSGIGVSKNLDYILYYYFCPED